MYLQNSWFCRLSECYKKEINFDVFKKLYENEDSEITMVMSVILCPFKTDQWR